MQVITKFIGPNAVTDPQIRLTNTGWLRARNAANSADVNLIQLNASNQITMGGPLYMGTNQIHNVTDPTSAQDASTKAYADTKVGSVTAPGSTPNANGLTLASGVLKLQPADLLHPGMLTNFTQSISGLKKFNAFCFNEFVDLTTTGDNADIPATSTANSFISLESTSLNSIASMDIATHFNTFITLFNNTGNNLTIVNGYGGAPGTSASFGINGGEDVLFANGTALTVFFNPGQGIWAIGYPSIPLDSPLVVQGILANENTTAVASNSTPFAIAQYDGSANLLAANLNNPQQQTVFTSGAGSFTVPVGAVAIKVRLLGAGGGGGGGGAGATSGGTGGDTTVGDDFLLAGGASGGTNGLATQGGAGGTVSIPSGYGLNGLAIAGGNGNAGSNSTATTQSAYGGGAAGPFGGAGASVSNAAGVAGATGSGSGGSAGGISAIGNPASGGGAGAFMEIILSPATYGGSFPESINYSVGAGGAGGTAGTTGYAGGAGGSGMVEFFVQFQ